MGSRPWRYYSSMTLQVQAWPEPVFAWEADGATLEGSRYRTEVVATALPWRWIMRLEMSNVREYDIKIYSCVAKNELHNQTVKGRIQIACMYIDSVIYI